MGISFRKILDSLFGTREMRVREESPAIDRLMKRDSGDIVECLPFCRI